MAFGKMAAGFHILNTTPAELRSTRRNSQGRLRALAFQAISDAFEARYIAHAVKTKCSPETRK